MREEAVGTLYVVYHDLSTIVGTIMGNITQLKDMLSSYNDIIICKRGCEHIMNEHEHIQTWDCSWTKITIFILDILNWWDCTTPQVT